MTRTIPEDIEMDHYGIVRCTACGAPIHTNQPVTQRQGLVLEFLRSYMKEHPYAPTLMEIAAHIGSKNQSTPHRLLVALERKGKLRRGYKNPRDITLMDEDTQ